MRSLLALTAAVVSALALTSVAGARPAIVGGAVAQPGAWPWAAAIQWVLPDGLVRTPNGKPDVFQVCTGSLIGDRWVLTAGHCVLDEGQVIGTPGAFFGGTQFQIVIGQENIANPSPDHVYTADASDVIALPPQAGGGLDGDLALIRLDRPAPQRAIRIPGAGQAAEAAAVTEPGDPSTVIGWGLTEENGPSVPDDLRQVDVPIVSDRDCAVAYPTLDFFGYTLIDFNPVTMVCAGLPEGGKDSCNGDSGGPLMAPSGDGWLQIGITSWGTGCARAGKPGVYSRLAGLYGFIVQSLAGNAEAPAGLPQVSAGAATVVAKRKATVGASVLPNGFATEYVIEIGLNRRYRTATARGYAGDGAAPQTVSFAATKLKPGTTYHYRITAVNVAGVVRSSDLTFTTKG